MKSTPTAQKLRGGYYTPPRIAQFLARWAVVGPGASVFEPSCGDGAILEAAACALLDAGATPECAARLVRGVEFDPKEAAKAEERLARIVGAPCDNCVHTGDFFEYCRQALKSDTRFDAVVGNPPFIRYQSFPEQYRQIAFYLMQRAGMHPNRLTNIWVPFLVAATQLLSDHGRLAMIIPAELLQVNYAAELRYFLSTHFQRITLITFKRLVFEGIQQEVVLLLAERNGGEHQGISTVELTDGDDLRGYDHIAPATFKAVDHSTEKWTMYFLDQKELDVLRRVRQHDALSAVGEVMDVDVGIVTGANDFFTLCERDVGRHALQPFTQSMVGRSGLLAGAVFDTRDWEVAAAGGAASYLLRVPDVPFERLEPMLKRFVRSGEEQGIHKGYKCRIRKRWYVVPSVWTPHAFMLRQVHQYPKVIVNDASATCTDTIHRVRARGGVPIALSAAAFTNSLTFAFSEIIGRSYGGGVLELEPNEAERLPLPLVGAERLDLGELDALLRRGDITSVLDITDKILLREGLGLSANDVRMLRGAWAKLRDRRINRKFGRRSERSTATSTARAS